MNPSRCKSRHLVPGRSNWWAMAPFIFFGSAIMQFDESSMTLAIASISKEENIEKSTLQWLTTIYYIGTAGMAVPLSFVGQRFGYVMVTLVECVLLIVLYVIAFFLDVKGTYGALVAVRFLIGCVSSGILVNRNTIVAVYTDSARRTRSVANTLTLRSILNVFMPFVGGLIINYAGWRYLNLVDAGLCLLTIACLIPFTEISRSSVDKSFDVLGSILLLFLIAAFDSAIVVLGGAIKKNDTAQYIAFGVLLPVSIILCASFCVVEKRAKNPIIMPRLIRCPLYDVMIMNLVNYMNMYALQCVMPLCYIAFGYKDDEVGYFTAGAAAMGFFSTYVVGVLVQRCVYRIVVPVEYALIIVCEALLFAFVRNDISASVVYFIYQFFIMSATQTSQNQLMNCVPRSYSNNVAGFPTLTRTIGQSLASCISLSVVDAIQGQQQNDGTQDPNQLLFDGVSVAMGIQLVFIVLCLMLSSFHIGNQNNESHKKGFNPNKIKELDLFEFEQLETEHMAASSYPHRRLPDRTEIIETTQSSTSFH